MGKSIHYVSRYIHEIIIPEISRSYCWDYLFTSIDDSMKIVSNECITAVE